MINICLKDRLVLMVIFGNVEGMFAHHAFIGGCVLFLSISDTYWHFKKKSLIEIPTLLPSVFLRCCQTTNNPALKNMRSWIFISVSYIVGTSLTLIKRDFWNISSHSINHQQFPTLSKVSATYIQRHLHLI